jgi:hypothetical protein
MTPMSISESASVLTMMSGRTDVRHPIIDSLRRASFSEVQRGLPAHFWVKDIVWPSGRRDKKFYSPEGTSFRSMKQAGESLKL